jgi:hypothetical protein
MSSVATLEGVKKIILFPFQGRKWGLKLLVGSALSLAGCIVPIFPLLPVMGYAGQVARRVISQEEDPQMPEWKDWGQLFSDGIKLFGAILLYLLPGILIMIAGAAVMFSSYSLFWFDPGFFSIPDSYSPGLLYIGMAGSLIGMLASMVGMLLFIATGLFIAPALGHMISRGEFKAAFRVREWWPVFKVNLAGFFLTQVLLLGVYAISIFAIYALYFSIILCFLVPFAMILTTFLLVVLHFSLSAVAYRDGVRKLVESGQAG